MKNSIEIFHSDSSGLVSSFNTGKMGALRIICSEFDESIFRDNLYIQMIVLLGL